MPFEVDPKFAASARNAKSRRRRRFGVRIVAGVSAAVLMASLAWLVLSVRNAEQTAMLPDLPDGETTATDGAELDTFALVQSQETAQAAIAIERLNSFVDLRRDPMILRFASADETAGVLLDTPADFAKGRLARGGMDAVRGLKDSLFVAEKRLVTTLPSGRDDFALFKAQRSQALDVASSPLQQSAPVHQGELVEVSEASSWGDLIANDDTATAPQGNTAIYVETQIENTTSVAVALRENQRLPLYEDEITVLQAERALQDVLMAAGLDESVALNIQRAATQKLGLPASLSADSTVALRLKPVPSGRNLMTMSVYGPDGYLASLAQVGAGRFESSADPWISEDLMSRRDEVQAGQQRPGEIRLLDAFYSAAIRNGIATKLVGELIVLMSQRFDLERFVAEGDHMVLLRAASPDPSGSDVGQFLYVGIHSNSESMACYILAKAEGPGYSCYDFSAARGQSGSRLGGGFLVPVDGVKTSGFGPRHHPILKQVRNHNGVDWAAPTGTPVLAVAGGRVTRAGDGGGYGNVVYLDHGEGVETRYAHLSRFAPGLRQGAVVGAGDVIGFVGTTGRSTGPHLHFELRVQGRPFDPLSYNGQLGTGPAQAVEALVNQIIRVESAGVSTAKNPRSTATGLGQFIESTWLRMMRDYRPDLMKTMGRAQLLGLRTDPALSREMVRNLARENEAFLRARGHQITAGRLYLAHFLGPAGANTALRADPEASVLSVMGAQVVNANPFLRGKTIADLRKWSDRKMRGSGRGRSSVSAPPVRRIPAEVVAFKKAVDGMLAEVGSL